VGASPDCPFCESGAVERIGLWGGQMITAQWRCQSCGSYFDAVREDFEDRRTTRTRPDPARPDAERAASPRPADPRDRP
jgi:transposase-like protein